MSFSCTEAQKAVEENSFDHDPAFVARFGNQGFEISELTFVEVASINTDFDSNGTSDKLLLYNCKGWENDPGDFRKIVLELNGNKVLESLNLGGWINLPIKLQQGSSPPSFLLIGSKIPVLAFVGYPYESEPGYLTLISVNGEKSELVFNQKFNLSNVTDASGQYSLEGEYEDKPATIFIDQAGLKFRN